MWICSNFEAFVCPFCLPHYVIPGLGSEAAVAAQSSGPGSLCVCLYVCSKCGPLGTGYLRYWALVTRYSVLGTRHSQSSHGYYRVQATRIYARRHLMTLSKHSPSWQAASKCGSCSSAGCSGAIPPSLHILSTGPWGRCVRPQSLCD